MTISQVQETLL